MDRRLVSQPLKQLLDDVGQAVFALNTAVVGLDAVESGHEKPKSLNVSWAPRDRRTAARKSRKFILESVLVRVTGAMYEYALALSKLPAFRDVSNLQNNGRAKMVSAIAKKSLPEDKYLIAGVVLLMHWRNRIVHRRSTAKLDPDDREALLGCDKIIAGRYRGLDIHALLRHFEEQRPTLKDASSLISMSINLARKIDSTIQHDLEKEELDAWLHHYQLIVPIERIKAATPPEKQQASIRRLIRTRAPKLLDAYLDHYPVAPP